MKEIMNTTFEMNVNGVQYTVWNGTWIEEGVCVRNDETQAYVIVRNEGAYENKSGVRKAIMKHVDELAVQRVETEEEQETVEEEQKVLDNIHREMLMDMSVDDEQEVLDNMHRALLMDVSEDEIATLAEYGAEMMTEQLVEVEEEQEVSEEEIVQTINDWIYRSLPKYVQKYIDYCDYVDGVYRIHVKTEHGSKEIAERRWVDAKDNARQFVKNSQ